MNASTKKRLIRFIGALTVFIWADAWSADQVVEQNLQVRLEPHQGRLEVIDSIRLPQASEAAGGWQFLLHAGLEPEILTPGAQMTFVSGSEGEVPLERYRVSLPKGKAQFTLSYGGKISHDLTAVNESLGRKQQRTPGTIGTSGVFLDNSSGWYPRFGDLRFSFTLKVDLPPDWLAVSQGQGPEVLRSDTKTQVGWTEPNPQDDIYLIAARFHRYARASATAANQVYLRTPEPLLAKRYLDATEDYLNLYSRLIGPYPYAKFALVENFWETGFGMPSFTLLGPRVIRLPFILHSSYPHEILHNWWGNSVYVDYDTGNWSEGLTTYLADHLLQERSGRGQAYRRNALQRYEHFVRHETDFPLSEFVSRHTAASQSVGYDKSLMFFHMLRRRLGDRQFLEGLRDFYNQYRFRTAGYEDLRHTFESASGMDLSGFFDQWTRRTGAPKLEVRDVSVAPVSEGYRIKARIIQTQKPPPFNLRIPIVVHPADGKTAVETHLNTEEREERLVLTVSDRPLRLDIDPGFDLFRRLDKEEIPPTLGALLGAEKGLLVLPAEVPAPLAQGYRALAAGWSQDQPGLDLARDDEITELPDDRPVWILGWNNRFRDAFAGSITDAPVKFATNRVRINSENYHRDQFSILLVTRRAGKKSPPLAWIGAQSPQTLPGLARKLPHYGKYSYLLFSGPEPEIQKKGQWPVIRSPLKIPLAKETTTATLPSRQPLTALLEDEPFGNHNMGQSHP